MFNGLSTTSHHRWIIFQPYLHRIDYGFMFPALYPALLTRLVHCFYIAQDWQLQNCTLLDHPFALHLTTHLRWN